MASSSPNCFTGRMLGTTAKQRGIWLWLGSSPSPPLHDGNGAVSPCRGVLILVEPRGVWPAAVSCFLCPNG